MVRASTSTLSGEGAERRGGAEGRSGVAERSGEERIALQLVGSMSGQLTRGEASPWNG